MQLLPLTRAQLKFFDQYRYNILSLSVVVDGWRPIFDSQTSMGSIINKVNGTVWSTSASIVSKNKKIYL